MDWDIPVETKIDKRIDKNNGSRMVSSDKNWVLISHTGESR
jgi:hypothetical protein